MGTKPRTMHAVVLAAVLLLAGCGGILGGPPAPAEPTETESPTETETATPTPQPTTEPGIETFSYPNGTSATSLNYSRLVRAHADALGSQSYAYTEVEVGGGDVRYRTVNNATSDLETQVRTGHFARNVHQGNESWTNETYDRYYANGTRHVRVTTDGNVTAERTNGSDDFNRTHDVASGPSVGNGDYRLVLSVFDWEAVETDTALDREVVRFESTDVARDAGQTTFADSSNATIEVTEDGEIVRLTFFLETADEEDVDRTIRTTYRVTALGDVSPSEPSWVADGNETESETETASETETES